MSDQTDSSFHGTLLPRAGRVSRRFQGGQETAGPQPGGNQFLDCVMDTSGDASEHHLTDSDYKKAGELATF
ncbi:hypothetical protein P0D69_09190 [Paraburkholderia sediminicola]|uniref:hypothetical protein n=1 Tax=Paraburkholderia sediminicola TaxID=458836 RepID=UPI0038B6FCE4